MCCVSVGGHTKKEPGQSQTLSCKSLTHPKHSLLLLPNHFRLLRIRNRRVVFGKIRGELGVVVAKNPSKSHLNLLDGVAPASNELVRIIVQVSPASAIADCDEERKGRETGNKTDIQLSAVPNVLDRTFGKVYDLFCGVVVHESISQICSGTSIRNVCEMFHRIFIYILSVPNSFVMLCMTP